MALPSKTMQHFTIALCHGNITKAAAELSITASAISSAIDQVETGFGLTLVTRKRARGIQANASGREVAGKIRAFSRRIPVRAHRRWEIAAWP